MKKDVSDLIKAIEAQTTSLHPLKQRIIKNALENLELVFNGKEDFTSFDNTKFLMWEYALSTAEKDVLAFATNRENKSGFGFSKNQHLLDIQRSAVKRGAKIHRIFALNQEDYQNFDFMELIRSQLKIGIKTSIIYDNLAEFVYSYQKTKRENFVIIDDKLLYRSYIENGVTTTSISFDKALIDQYMATFRQLRARSYSFQISDLPKDFNEL